MSNYECYYYSGRQCVFEERAQMVCVDALVWLFWLCGLGAVFGSICVLTVSIGGVRQLERLFFLVAAYIALHAYFLCFQRSSSVDLFQYVLLCLLIAVFLCGILAALQYSVLLHFNVMALGALFSIIGLVCGLGSKFFQLLWCQEDQRKHLLTVCSPCHDGCVPADQAARNKPSSLETLTRFLVWFFSWQWYALHSSRAQECMPSESITVHNRTLKLIKVCFYVSDDMCCWVPFGGIAGRCVAFIPAEQSHTFKPPRYSSESGGSLRLKVFQPGLFDKELACFCQAKSGQSFAFIELERMVRRSKHSSSKSLQRRRQLDDGACSGRTSSWSGQSVESSESEYEPVAPVNVEAASSTSACSDTGDGKAVSSDEPGLIRRNRSTGDLQRHHRASASHNVSESTRQANQRHLTSGDAPAVCRRAAPNEVVVRNCSNQEIRALLFRLDDYCFFCPLVGHVMACGDCILPDGERRFDPRKDLSNEFTLKVYSVGAGAKELTYCTVRRGHTYTFCDSLLS